MENWSEEDQLIDIIISTINISTMDNGFDLKSKFGAIFIQILWFLPHGHVWCQNYVKMSNQFCESHSADKFRIFMKNTMIANVLIFNGSFINKYQANLCYLL